MIHEPLAPLMEHTGYGSLHTFCHFELGVIIIIAIHSTKQGPAIGGCRLQSYPSYYDAFVDAIKLGQGMTQKAAIQQLPHGGGKAVIMQLGPSEHPREAIFEQLGRCIDSMGGQYITAIDSGTTQADMDVVASQTPYVIAKDHCHELKNPAIFTASGVVKAMEATRLFYHGDASLAGLHIVIQGVGASGLHLCQLLTERGARLTVSDLDLCRSRIAKERYGATIASVNTVHKTPCDIFSPCAFGGSLNRHTIPLLNTQMVVGCANNICQNPIADSAHLHERNIVYIPDYLSNGGGLIHAAHSYAGKPLSATNDHLETLYATTLAVLEQAKATNCAPYTVTENMLNSDELEISSAHHEPEPA